MKKIGLVLTTFLSVMIFTGCSNDNDELQDDEINSNVVNGNEVIDEEVVIANTAPEFYPQSFTVDENASTNYSVGYLVASDSEGNTLDYFQKDRDVPFVVDEVTGEITVSSNDIDYEKNTFFQFDVAVEDGEFSTRATIVIRINDIKE